LKSKSKSAQAQEEARCKEQQAGAGSEILLVAGVILCVLNMCTHAAATSNCRLQQLNISLPTAAITAGVTTDIEIAIATTATAITNSIQLRL
jgi:hypothetical protein